MITTPNVYTRLKAFSNDVYMAFDEVVRKLMAVAHRAEEAVTIAEAAGSDPFTGPFDGLVVIKTAESGISEPIITAGVSDAAGRWILGNGSAVDGRYTSRTTITQTQPVAGGGEPANEVLAVIDTEDATNDYAAHRFTTQLVGGGPLTTQKIWELVNGSDRVIFAQPVNPASPDVVTLVINNGDFADPTYSTSGGAFSGGSRLVLEQNRSPTAVDSEIGMCSYGPYVAARNTSQRFSLFFGTSNPFYVEGNGRVNCGPINPGTGGNKGLITADNIPSPEGAITADPGAIHMGANPFQPSVGRFSFKGYGVNDNTGWFSLYGGFIDPEGGVEARPGSLYLRFDSIGGGGSLYQKISGNYATGWKRIAYGLEGTGDPNGVWVGTVGDTYVDRTGTPGAVFYVKESDPTPDTGWVAK